MSATQLSDALYLRYRELVARRSGLHFPESKRADLEHALTMAIAQSAYDDLDALYAAAVQGGAAWTLLLSYLTIGETYFFRNEAQFHALRQHILPEIIGRRANGPGAARRLRLWSAGCASGEEPYSLAMLLQDLVPNIDAWSVMILGTDINGLSLARAREALYGDWSFRETPPAARARWFDEEGGRWRLRAEIRRTVTFSELNLVERSFPAIANGTTGLDLILCRNVTIYFDEPTTRTIVDQLYDALAPGGWLVVGHAEPHAGIYQRFETHNFPNAVVYRKPLGAPPFPIPLQLGQHLPLAGERTLPPTALQIVAERTSAARRERTTVPAPVADHAAAWQRVDAALLRDDAAQAEADLKALLRSAPNDPRALCALARLQANRGDLVSAQQACSAARRHNPLYRDAYYLAALVHELQREWELAVAAYRHAVFLDATLVAAIIGMARAYATLNQPSQAQRCYRNALKQLVHVPREREVPEMDGASASEVVEHVENQLRQLVAATG